MLLAFVKKPELAAPSVFSSLLRSLELFHCSNYNLLSMSIYVMMNLGDRLSPVVSPETFSGKGWRVAFNLLDTVILITSTGCI